MMNVLALCLVFTSLFATEILSPVPEKPLNQKEDGIVKGGRRIIVVETYDEGGHHNTKVSISPEQQQQQQQQETVSAAGGAEEAIARKRKMAREVKEKVEGAYGKAKEYVSEKVHGAKETYTKAEESAAHQAHDVKESVKKIENDAAEKAKEKTERAKERVWRFVNDAVKYVYSKEVVNSLMGMANLLGFAAAYGMCVWVTFASSYVLAGALPRQQFALVQGKIYPVYLKAMAYCIGVTLLSHLVGKTKLLFTSPAEIFQGHNLVASVFMVLFNAMYSDH